MTFQVFIATHSKQLASHVERKASCGGLSAVAIEPTAEKILVWVGESEPCVVVIDALQNDEDALAIVKVLTESRPKAKAVILGRNPDLSLVARAIVAGASHFLLENTPADEFGKALVDLVTGKQPTEESLFGRVYGSLPTPESRGGWFRSRSGRRLSTEDAIKQCDQFGFSVDEITDYLKIPISDAERVTKKARKLVSPSLLSRILASVMPAGGGASRGQLALIFGCLAITIVLSLFMGRQNRGLMPYELAPVSGTVSLDGAPVAGGAVRLGPDHLQNTRGPTGVGLLDGTGRFSIMTAGREGAVVGHHRIAVVPKPMLDSGTGTVPPQAFPTIFTRASDSGLTCEVKRGKPNTLEIKLVTPQKSPAKRTSPKK
jgi:DNA-binding NarL/FixJ family response regulator